MRLKVFVKRYICKNAFIRLWAAQPCGIHTALDSERGVVPALSIIHGKGWWSEYAAWDVVCVRDALQGSSGDGAVNIAIKEPKGGC